MQSTSRISLLQKVQELRIRKPNFYDVVFCVGPAKKEVKGVRILLEAASPIMAKKFELWNVKGQGIFAGGIPLPEVDPDAFEVFVELTMLDSWTTEVLKSFNLRPDQILNLISICRLFEMEDSVKQLENLMQIFYNAFAAFKEIPDFFRLSRENLRTILSSDNLQLNETDVFDCACRWAKAECVKNVMESNAENHRLVLGDCIFEIRFPLMTTAEFTQCVEQHNILTPEENSTVLKFIGNNNNESEERNSSVAKLPFKTKPRSRAVLVQFQVDSEVEPKFSTLCLTLDSPIVRSPPFVCDGSENINCIATKRKIMVHGLGFLGPIDGDAYFIVIVRFRNSGHDKSFESKWIQKRIFAQKGNVFRIMFDQPIELKEGSMETWTNYYVITYSLKGPKTESFQRTFEYLGECVKHDGGNEFCLGWESNQLAEVLYSNVD